MSTQDNAAIVGTIARWMSKTLSSGLPPTTETVRTWAEALATVSESIAAQQSAASSPANAAETKGVDRLDAAYCEGMFTQSIRALERVAVTAIDSTDNPRLARAIKNDARTIAETLEALTIGVARPTYSPTKTGV
jgi:hypothetical protein